MVYNNDRLKIIMGKLYLMIFKIGRFQFQLAMQTCEMEQIDIELYNFYKIGNIYKFFKSKTIL